jgi:uncharacterized OB-fold protein
MSRTIPSDDVLRIPPPITARSAPFWRGGADGKLLVPHCQACGNWYLPPAPVCPACLSRDTEFAEATGRGIVAAFTINRHEWIPERRVGPYIIAIVELIEQAGLRMITNIVNCPVDEVRTGMEVRALFMQVADAWLPVFEPEGV